MATYAIGDIQGCYDEFIDLLELIAFDPKQDQLWIAGDMVNRGPKSLAVLRWLYAHQDKVQCVLGNHDLHLLAVAAGLRKPNRSDTLDDIITAADGTELLDWLRQQPLFFYSETEQTSMVHAGIPPIWSLNQTQERAKEVSQILQSEDWREFVAAMYGNEPVQWHDTLTGMARLRCITNYLTRMRFCTADGELDLVDKSSTTSSKVGFKPWFDHPHPQLTDAQEHVIFGHWAALQGRTGLARYHALDTGCVWGEQLTAMNVTTQQRYTVSSRR